MFMADPSLAPGSLYLGLATAIAAITASAVGLGLLRPSRRTTQLASLAVVLASVLGIAAAFIVVASEEPTGLLHVAIAAGLLVPGGYVLVRGLDSIFHGHRYDDSALDGIRISGSLPAGESPGSPRSHTRRVLLAASGYLVAVALLLAISTPGLLDAILQPEDPAPQAMGGYAPSHRPVLSCLEGGFDCPGPGYATFNSYRNAPNYGDERAFIDAKAARNRTPGGYQDVLEVKPGETIIIRGYLNNAGDARFEANPGASIARGVRMRILLPRGRRDLQAVAGEISAENTIPRAVSDTVTLWAHEDFVVRYVPGSAKLFNSVHPHGLRLPDDLVNDGTRPAEGAMLGFRTLDGRIRGRFEESGLVTLEVAIT
jgi:hypothetical protein